MSAEEEHGQDARGTLWYTDTHEPGVYVVRSLGTTGVSPVPDSDETAVVVNIDPEEADPRTIEPRELQRRLGDAPLIVAENPEDLSDVFRRLREGYSLWEVFLWVVLLVLVFETFLANRFVPKGEALP